ncbi:hypothetical protein SAMN02745121_08094 [Nannocystis exedens]|uniref:Uncharacterized protein n=1 Tax=Nannocystis exedens TaxID=54 RepID=A0A1I2HPN9_9BACT|nr:hypothetical protein [Nannocystis exedens]SFF31393.1 hypothetical protein SAMN02745121_08094 [Nannocystis exedens]
MRTILLVASIALACTLRAQEAAPDTKPVDTKPVAPPAPAAPPAPPTPPAPPAPPPVADPPAAPAPAAPATWLAGPDRYQLPTKVGCLEAEEGGPFCGVHVIDLEGDKTTTLLSRDRKTWVVRAGKAETPTTVEFVKTPRPAGLLKRVEPPFKSPGSGSTVAVEPAHPLLPEPFELAAVRSFLDDFALVGDKLYGIGLVEETRLLEIDPASRSFVAVDLAGKSPLAVFPHGSELALYLSGGRKKSVATFDPSARKLLRKLEIPRDLEPECRRTHHYYDEEAVYFVSAAGRFYVSFSCYPDA